MIKRIYFNASPVAFKQDHNLQRLELATEGGTHLTLEGKFDVLGLHPAWVDLNMPMRITVEYAAREKCGLKDCEEPAVTVAYAIMPLPEEMPTVIGKMEVAICQKHRDMIEADKHIKITMSSKVVDRKE